MNRPDDVSHTPVEAPDTQPTTQDLEVLQGQSETAEAISRQARRLFTHAPTPMLLVTKAGRIADANLRAGQLLGLSPERLTGRRLEKFVATGSQSTLAALLRGVFTQGGLQNAELVMVTPDGAIRTVRGDAVHDPGDEGSPAWCHLSLTDITDLQAIHTQLLDQTDMLQAQLQHLTARQYRLEHEVQDVIRSTQAQLNLHLARLQNLLKRHVRDAGASSDLTLAQDALNRTLGLLASLDGYVQARQLRLRPRHVDLNQVLQDVRSDLKDALDGRTVEWNTGPLPTVYGDSRALRMILTAYLSNALKFTRTREAARIRLLVEEHEGEYLIGVQDNGIGFNNRLKDKAFELFGRLHPTGAYEGAGIDLATVRQLCDLMGRRAWGDGKVDQGATFWFACPKTE